MKALGYKAVLYIKGLNYTLKVVSLTTTKRYTSMFLLEQSIAWEWYNQKSIFVTDNRKVFGIEFEMLSGVYFFSKSCHQRLGDE